jgi:DNA-binding IclR family transcriptional regulator
LRLEPAVPTEAAGDGGDAAQSPSAPFTAGGVAAVDRAMRLLMAFVDGPDTLSLADLARRTGLYKSTVLRLAASLERAGALHRDPGGDFRLGPTVFRLGTRYIDAFDLRAHALPVMQRLADETGESTSFYVREGAVRVCVFRVHATQHRILHYLRPGTQFPADTGAAGRVLTSWSAPYREDAEAIRADVLALSVAGRTIADTAAMSVPVFGANRELVGAISLAGPATRLGPRDRGRLARALLAAGIALTTALGGDARVLRARRDAVADDPDAGA